MTPCWNDFKTVQFTECHSSRLDGTKQFCAHYDEISKEDHTYVCIEKSIKDVKTVGYWYSTAKVKTVRWNNVKTSPKPSEWTSDCTESLENPSQQTSTAKSQSTVLKIQWRSRMSWPENWMEMVSFSCFIKFVFVMVALIDKWWQASSWDEECFFHPTARRFACRQWRYPCKRREV